MPDFSLVDWALRYHGQTPLARFANSVSRANDGCWVWTSYRNQLGYGVFSVQRQRFYAHRFMFELWYGPVPEGLELDHLCRNPPCCNPEHLEPVTRWENNIRGESLSSKNARATLCPKGHAYTADNLYVRPDGRGINCRSCVQARTEARLARERAARRARGLKRSPTRGRL